MHTALELLSAKNGMSNFVQNVVVKIYVTTTVSIKIVLIINIKHRLTAFKKTMKASLNATFLFKKKEKESIWFKLSEVYTSLGTWRYQLVSSYDYKMIQYCILMILYHNI